MLGTFVANEQRLPLNVPFIILVVVLYSEITIFTLEVKVVVFPLRQAAE